MKKRYAWYLPALLFLVPLGFPFKSELVIVPGVKEYKYVTYSDSVDSAGNSVCNVSKGAGSSIVFDYTLHKWNVDPYAGFTIDLFGTDSFIDITSYDSICVDMVTTKSSSFEIQLKFFIENVTERDDTITKRQDDWRTCHTLTCEVPVDIGLKRYSISKNSFRLASWWDKETFKKYGQRARTLPRIPDYSKLFGINFHNGSSMAENIPDRFTITKVAFVKERKKNAIALLCGVCFAIYSLIVSFIVFRRKLQGKPPKGEISSDEPAPSPTPPQPIIPEMEPILDEEVRRLEEYIGTHYQAPELTVEQVGHGAGISPVRVTSILQEKYNKTYKQYLNDIRITAAKQLLIKSDRSIAEIAFTAGYNNIPHFNRVFKEIVDCSPGEYREKRKASNSDSRS